MRWLSEAGLPIRIEASEASHRDAPGPPRASPGRSSAAAPPANATPNAPRRLMSMQFLSSVGTYDTDVIRKEGSSIAQPLRGMVTVVSTSAGSRIFPIIVGNAVPTNDARLRGRTRMRQTTLSVALEVKPESFDHLSGLLDALRDRRSQNPSGARAPMPIS